MPEEHEDVEATLEQGTTPDASQQKGTWRAIDRIAGGTFIAEVLWGLWWLITQVCRLIPWNPHVSIEHFAQFYCGVGLGVLSVGYLTLILWPIIFNIFKQGKDPKQDNDPRWFHARILSSGIVGGSYAFLLPAVMGLEEGSVTSGGAAALRQAILLATGGLIALIALGETRRKNDNDKLKNDQDKEKNDREHLRQVRAGRRERYTKAVEQLGDEKSTVRMGGVYTLVGLVDEWLEEKSLSDDQRFKEGQVIINNLCAYIRSPFTPASRKANLQAEADVRLSIIKEIHDRLQGPDKNIPGAWSDFEYNFSGSTFFYPINLTKSYYKKPVNFDGSTYQELAVFSGSTYEKGVIFSTSDSPSTYQDVAVFSDSTYYGKAVFSDSIYQNLAVFSDSIYQNLAVFSDSTYYGKAVFSDSIYQNLAVFSDSIYQDLAAFSGSTYEKSVIFSTSDSPSTYQDVAAFSDSTYQDAAAFSGSTYEKGVIFSTSDSPSTYQGSTHFGDSTYYGKASFSNSTYQDLASFSGSTYQDLAAFSGSTYEKSVIFSTSDSPSTYQDVAAFSDSTYQDAAAFSGSTYEKGVIFSTSDSPSTYQGSTHFGDSTYYGKASFSNSTYQDLASFSDSTYKNKAYFSNSTYQNLASFSDSTYKNKAYFNDSTYLGRAAFSGSTYESEAEFSRSVFYQETYFGEDGDINSFSRFTDCTPQFYNEKSHQNALFGSPNNNFTVENGRGYPIYRSLEGLPLDCKFLTSEQKEYLEGKFQEIEKINNKLLEAKDPKEKAELSKKLQALNEELHKWREEVTTV